jgi:hypothetical protein
MGWQKDAMLLGGLAVAAYAAVYYVLPKMREGIGEATTAAASTVGTAIGAAGGGVVVGAVTPVVEAFNPFNPHAVQNEPLYQAGYNLGSWVNSLPWILQPGIKQLGLI